MIEEYAPLALSALLAEPVPVRISLAGQVIAPRYERREPGLLEGRYGDLAIAIEYRFQPEFGVVSWRVRLGNVGQSPVRDLALAPFMLRLRLDPTQDLPRVRHMSGSYHYDAVYPPRAFRLSEERIMTHDHCKPVRIESADLGSAGNHVPVLEFALGPYGHMIGFFVGFEWSARWHLEVRWERNSFQGEPCPDLLVEGNVGLGGFDLSPGEWVELPTVHLGFVEGADWGAFDRSLRRYVREGLAARLRGYVPLPPVSYDHWFGIHRSFDVADLKRQADRAAELGCEYFCLDAGWYACPGDWGSGIGNWFTPDPDKFPRGIEELSRHVRSLGMGFGIWHQIEWAAPGTEALRRYPGIYTDGHLRLDLAEAGRVAFEIISQWIRAWNLTWMRWECAQLDWLYQLDPSGKLTLRYMQGFYGLVDTLRAAFPDLYIEGCQGGGTRLDWGMAARTHGAWLSDHTAQPDVCRYMQASASHFWPAHFLNSAVRAHRNSGDAEATPHNLLSRMVGTMSFNGDIAQWSPEAAQLAHRYVRVYKQIRPLLSQPVLFPLPQPHSDRDWDVVLVGDGQGEKSLLYAFRLEGPERVRVDVPQGTWEQLAGASGAHLEPYGAGLVLRLDRHSSALWQLRLAD